MPKNSPKDETSDDSKTRQAVESIKYPISIYGDFKQTKQFAIDIGGSLVKLVYLVEESTNRTTEGIETRTTNYHMRFVKFETKYIESCLDFIQRHYMKNGISILSHVISATGGGAYKYKELIKNKLGLDVEKYDEMNCIIKGSIFLLKNIKHECFEFDKDNLPCVTYEKNTTEPIFPFLLVNIGSGVSFIKVESDDEFQRVGGTSLGGGTFWGLCSLLTDASCFDDMISMASTGDSRNIDMLVQDIYGGDYEFMGLDKNLIASTFGKCARSGTDPHSMNPNHFKQNDMSASLLRMISYNIGQLAVLYASLNKIHKIYFGGYFLRSHFLPIKYISEAVGFYSKSQFSALFFKHDGFFGALGAYHIGMLSSPEFDLKNEGICKNMAFHVGVFEENIATSSFSIYNVTNHNHPIKIISLDYTYDCSSAFPLLLSGGQVVFPRDSILNMVRYLKEWVPLFVNEFKVHYQCEQNKHDQLCANFAKMTLLRLDCYQISDPHKIKNYLIDILFIQDQFVKEFLLLDPFLNYKHSQNLLAIKEYKDFIEKLDGITSDIHRFELIFKHIHAGNIADFASNEFLKLKASQKLNNDECFNIISKTVNHIIGGSVEIWIASILSGVYKNVLIFTDNSGFELVFGVFSLAREFLKKGSRVILAANTYPSFNDVVSSELILIANRLRFVCSIIDREIDQNLKIAQTGMGSPFLNLLCMNTEFCKLVEGVDLIIFVGASRSLVAFTDSLFLCDTVFIGSVTSEIFADKYKMNVFDTYIKFNCTSKN